MSLPPELRVLCRKLASSNPEDLPRLCPTLVAYVLRCAWPLSAPLEARAKDRAKAKEGSSEASTLVHKLRTQIHSLLHGRVPSGRFAAIVLVKALVDVGGWECLRASGPWVQALLAVLKKPDTPATKELCIITLVPHGS
ncbi:hypothetical protein P8C59_006600 [Phyllachora maydis]|uniref:Pre-rRNA-processing protein RIX1 N-terminal domain-containing protein n=1 Tax=Phyllachora maydis TaxID=1825666 RepID=A0AAD9I6M3_9PEZI|nr:hypothetical protein P8C59_006600 [Phyllachora maydis]